MEQASLHLYYVDNVDFTEMIAALFTLLLLPLLPGFYILVNACRAWDGRRRDCNTVICIGTCQYLNRVGLIKSLLYLITSLLLGALNPSINNFEKNMPIPTYTRIHSLMIFGYLIDFELLFRVLGARPLWFKSCIQFLRTAGSLNPHLYFSVLFSQVWWRRIGAKVTCNCGGNCPDHNVQSW